MMRLVRGFWKLLVGIKDALVLLLLLLFFGILFAALSMSPNPRIAASGALLLDLRGSLVEQPSQTDTLAALTSSRAPSREFRLRDVVRGIAGAAHDPSVKAIVLDLDSFTGGGQATIAAAGEAIDAARRAGKPVLAFATGYGDDSYQLAAHASEIWLDPQGAVLLAGPGSPHLYYKGLLDKLGVEVKDYRVGKFKSAVEPYIRADQSPEARAANQALADSLWANWQDEVGRARPKAKIAPYAAAPDKALAAAGGDSAQAAVSAGLVDRLGDRIAFGKRVAELAGPDNDKTAGGYQAIPLGGWLMNHPAPKGGDAIGVVTIAGNIVDGEAPPGTAGGTTISRLILDALAKKGLKALVVRVDSPGGSVTASERIRSAILEAKRQGLPIVVSMGSVAASGGYWVSTPADRIFAEPATITGSIGVFGLIPTFKGTLAKLGLSADGVGTTPLSGQPDVYRGTSPTFDALIQTGIEAVYKRFTGIVAASRHLTPARVDEIGQGHVWAGGIARQIGLVDQFGGLDDAIADAARRAKLDPANVHPVFIERGPSRAARLLAMLSRRRDADGDDDARADAWTRLAHAPERDLLRALGDVSAMLDGPAIQVQCLDCPVTAPPRAADPKLAALLLARLGIR